MRHPETANKGSLWLECRPPWQCVHIYILVVGAIQIVYSSVIGSLAWKKKPLMVLNTMNDVHMNVAGCFWPEYPGRTSQFYERRCLGSWHHQSSPRHGIGYVGWKSPCLPWGMVSTIILVTSHFISKSLIPKKKIICITEFTNCHVSCAQNDSNNRQ